MSHYQLFTPSTVPGDAIVVHIRSTHGVVQGFVDRRLAVVEGSVSLDRQDGPMAVQEALEQANAELVVLRPHGFSRIAVVLDAGTDWSAKWGHIDRSHLG